MALQERYAYRKREVPYTYDSCDRPESVKFDLNHSGTSITLAAYTYDKFGRLQSREFHGASADKLTYAYNLRGWLTGISGTKFARILLQHRHQCCQVQRQHQQHDVESRE